MPAPALLKRTTTLDQNDLTAPKAQLEECPLWMRDSRMSRSSVPWKSAIRGGILMLVNSIFLQKNPDHYTEEDAS